VGWLAENCFITSTCLTKVSILLFHRRLMTRTYSHKLMWAIQAAIIFTTLFWMSAVLFLWLQCTPLDAAWKSVDISYPETYQCARRDITDPLVGALSVVSDAYTLVLPELLIRELKMSHKQKVVLYAVFGSGLL